MSAGAMALVEAWTEMAKTFGKCNRCQHRHAEHAADGACNVLRAGSRGYCPCDGYSSSDTADWASLVTDLHDTMGPFPKSGEPSEELWPIAVCMSAYGKGGPYYVYAFCKTLTEGRQIQNIYRKPGEMWNWRLWDRQAKAWIKKPSDPEKVMDVIGRNHD